MLELMRHFSEVFIGREEIRYVFDHSAQGSNLRQLVIDQLRWDLQNGFLSEFSIDARFAEDVGPLSLETSLKANGGTINPQTQKARYLEVLTGTDGE